MVRVTQGIDTQRITNEIPETSLGQQEIGASAGNADKEQFLQEKDDSGYIGPAKNGISIPHIVDQKVPIVVFVGPASSGKSMILVRLAKYLHSVGYSVKADPTFLSTAEYQNHCKEFNNTLNTDKALDGTVRFLLVDVKKEGKLIAKLLEAPGEDYYTTMPDQIKAGKNETIEMYLDAIITSNNPKSYVVLLDLDSEISFRIHFNHREAYQNRFINYFYNTIDTNRDRIILLYNKIDTTDFGNINGCKNLAGAKEDAKKYYPQLFSTMKIKSLGGFITLDNFVFKTFCSGRFPSNQNALGETYKAFYPASDIYPKELWKEIIKKW